MDSVACSDLVVFAEEPIDSSGVLITGDVAGHSFVRFDRRRDGKSFERTLLLGKKKKKKTPENDEIPVARGLCRNLRSSRKALFKLTAG